MAWLRFRWMLCGLDWAGVMDTQEVTLSCMIHVTVVVCEHKVPFTWAVHGAVTSAGLQNVPFPVHGVKSSSAWALPWVLLVLGLQTHLASTPQAPALQPPACAC